MSQISLTKSFIYKIYSFVNYSVITVVLLLTLETGKPLQFYDVNAKKSASDSNDHRKYVVLTKKSTLIYIYNFYTH